MDPDSGKLVLGIGFVFLALVGFVFENTDSNGEFHFPWPKRWRKKQDPERPR